MYGLPEQPIRLTMLTSTSVIALMKATPEIVPHRPEPYEVDGVDFVIE